MGELSLHVGGMRCRRCVRTVTARLRDVPGVETVTADADRSLIRLSGTMAVADVLDAFTGSTFVPEPLGEPDSDGAVQQRSAVR